MKKPTLNLSPLRVVSRLAIHTPQLKALALAVGLGVIAAGVGTVVVLAAPSRPSGTASAAVAASPSPGQPGVALAQPAAPVSVPALSPPVVPPPLVPPPLVPPPLVPPLLVPPLLVPPPLASTPKAPAGGPSGHATQINSSLYPTLKDAQDAIQNPPGSVGFYSLACSPGSFTISPGAWTTLDGFSSYGHAMITCNVTSQDGFSGVAGLSCSSPLDLLTCVYPPFINPGVPGFAIATFAVHLDPGSVATVQIPVALPVGFGGSVTSGPQPRTSGGSGTLEIAGLTLPKPPAVSIPFSVVAPAFTMACQGPASVTAPPPGSLPAILSVGCSVASEDTAQRVTVEVRGTTTSGPTLPASTCTPGPVGNPQFCALALIGPAASGPWVLTFRGTRWGLVVSQTITIDVP